MSLQLDHESPSSPDVENTTAASSPPEEHKNELQLKNDNSSILSSVQQVLYTPVKNGLEELFDENVVAKIWRVAVRELQNNNPPTKYPEYVPQDGPGKNIYAMREADFWTCGFFPGSLYALLERSMKYPKYLDIPQKNRSSFQSQLLELCRTWTGPIRQMDTRTDTHDMGFIFLPTFRMDWELTGNVDSLQCVLTAAESLASRYDERVGAIRSWDQAINYRYNYTDMETDFLVIIDSMCNLDLLYYAGHHTGNQRLIDIATTHAHKVLDAIVRENWSTYHLVVFDAQTGAVKERLTNQGYADWSTWSRGQSWAILGFIQTYHWTHELCFLEAAISLTNFFLSQLSVAAAEGTHSHPYVPLWDFDAPVVPTPTSGVLRDTSAGVIAANGMLLIHQALIGEGKPHNASTFLSSALRIVREIVDLSLAKEKAVFDTSDTEHPFVKEATPASFDSILMHATVNYHEFSHRRYADHGLVYADYFFLEFGNKLMRMNLV